MNTMTVEDILVTHVGSLSRDAQWEDKVGSGRISDWWKWPVRREEYRVIDQGKTAKTSRSPSEEPVGFMIYMTSGRLCKKDTESEDEMEKQQWSEREIVCPWERSE